jgi:hypothetical protein
MCEYLMTMLFIWIIIVGVIAFLVHIHNASKAADAKLAKKY